MKHTQSSANPTAPLILETFGGDYHRLESEFRPKKQLTLPTAVRDKRSDKPRKRKRSGTV